MKLLFLVISLVLCLSQTANAQHQENNNTNKLRGSIVEEGLTHRQLQENEKQMLIFCQNFDCKGGWTQSVLPINTYTSGGLHVPHGASFVIVPKGVMLLFKFLSSPGRMGFLKVVADESDIYEDLTGRLGLPGLRMYNIVVL